MAPKAKTIRKKLVMSFPPTLVEEPVTYKLIKDFNLEVNIMRARVDPRKQGRMVLEIKGAKADLDRAYQYLDESGIQLDPLVQEMRHIKEHCVNCTACTAVCPTGALKVEKATGEVEFEPSLCIICESCIPTCSYGALESQF